MAKYILTSINKHLYNLYSSIKIRCYDKNHKDYNNYGGRGIKMCYRWKTNPKSFIEWAIQNGWDKGLQIDRINNNSDYRPDNCRFVTGKENSNNKRNNVRISFNNKTQTLTQWAEELNININTLYSRIKELKWTIEQAITTPVRKKNG